MKSKLIYPMVLVVFAAAGCGGRSDARNAAQQQYETVQEGSAVGVTSTIQGPGETLPPITGTNADTTSAFALNPAAIPPAGTQPQPAQVGALPPPMMSSSPTPAAQPAPRPVTSAPQQAQQPRPASAQPAPAQPEPGQPQPTQPKPAEPQPSEPQQTETAEATGPATDTGTPTPPPAEKPKEEPPPPADDTSGTQAEEPPPPPPPAL